MNIKILPFIAILAFAAAPVVIGSATESKKDEVKTTEKTAKADGKDAKEGEKADAEVAETKPARKLSSECLASEEVIADLEAREQKLKQREEKLKERETEVAAQVASVKEEMAKVEGKRAELTSVHEKELAAHEEQVNKLIETIESMSPKTAAAVLGAVDDELAVLALGKITSVKAGKILGNLKPEKSAHLSEMMAYGKTKNAGKETAHGESDDRAPASTKR